MSFLGGNNFIKNRRISSIVLNFIVMVKTYCAFFLALLLCACGGHPSSNSAEHVPKKDQPATPAKQSDLSVQKGTIFQKKTAIIDGARYTAYVSFGDKETKFCIKNNDGHIVFTEKDLVGFEFKDVDGDGNKDLLLERSGISSGHQDLVQYDPTTKKFILVGNCSNADRIKNTKYFYSYEDCCVGRYWSSDLFYI